MGDDYRENENGIVTENEGKSLEARSDVPSFEGVQAAEQIKDDENRTEGANSGDDNKADDGEYGAGHRNKSKRIARIIWAAALSGALAILLVLFLPIFFANHVENTFGAILPDGEILTELIDEISENAFSEKLSIDIPCGNFSPEQVGLHTVSYGTGTDGDGREKITLDLNTMDGDVKAEIFIDGDTVTIGGIDAAGGFITFSRDNFKEELSRSRLHPESGGSCALDAASYKELESIFDETSTEVYEEFFDELLSVWLKVMDKESDISFGGIFKLEREVTYTASYEQLCRMADLFYNKARTENLLDVFGIDEKTISDIKASMKGVTIELGYKVSGSELASARLHFYRVKVDSFPFNSNNDKEVITGDVTYLLTPIIDDGRTVGAELFVNDIGTVLDTRYRYLTSEDEEKMYCSLTQKNRSGETEIIKAEYEKKTYRYSIQFPSLAVKQEISGAFRVDEKNGVVYISAKYKIKGVTHLSFLYEIKGDDTVNSIAFESGVSLSEATDRELKSFLECIGLGHMIKKRN